MLTLEPAAETSLAPNAVRIRLCTAEVGCGHTRAATAAALALRQLRPHADVKIVNALEHAPSWFTRVYRDGYLFLTKRSPRVVGWMYDRSDRGGQHSRRGRLDRLGRRLEVTALKLFAEDEQIRGADVLVCTHFLCARVLGDLRAAGRLHSKIAVIVTDQHPHAVWRVGDADLYLVASDAARETMIGHGFPADRVIVTGIPIDQRFASPLPRALARRRHDLPEDRPIALISGGGLGLGGIDAALAGFLGVEGSAHAVAVCGHNERLRVKIAAWLALLPHFQRQRVQLLGVTSHMHELMAAADLVVGKPGGLTTAEALASGLPMVLLKPIPGQESRNAAMLVESGAARLLTQPAAAGSEAAKLLAGGTELETMRSQARTLGRGDSAARAAQAVARLCPASVERST